MAQVAISTLYFVKTLTDSGVPPKQAEAHVEVLMDVMQLKLDGLATKLEIQDVRHEIQDVRHEIRAVESRLNARIDHVEHALKATESRLDAKIDHVQHALEAKMDHKFAALHWMFCVLIAGVVAPQIFRLFM